jgi:hypothetical protein
MISCQALVSAGSCEFALSVVVLPQFSVRLSPVKGQLRAQKQEKVLTSSVEPA